MQDDTKLERPVRTLGRYLAVGASAAAIISAIIGYLAFAHQAKWPPFTAGRSESTESLGSAPPEVLLAQGPLAPEGYRYAVTLRNFPANASITITCHDSHEPDGFATFAMTTDDTGWAYNESQCYSNDGPEYWVRAAAVESVHATWHGPNVLLGPGPPAPEGYRYAVTLRNFPANVSITITCHDSHEPDGFATFAMTTDDTGWAYNESQCYSNDGPEYWVRASGIESSHATW